MKVLKLQNGLFFRIFSNGSLILFSDMCAWSLRGLLVDPIPNSPNWHHKNYTEGSKKNYKWDLGKEMLKMYAIWDTETWLSETSFTTKTQWFEDNGKENKIK